MHFRGKRFPGAGIVQRKFTNRHPAHGNRHARPFAERLFELIFFRSDEHDQLSDTGTLQRQYRPLKETNAHDLGERTQGLPHGPAEQIIDGKRTPVQSPCSSVPFSSARSLIFVPSNGQRTLT